MINVLLIFLALTITICFIVGFSIFVVGVNACGKDNSDDTTITPEEAEKLEDALYSVAFSCKTELQVIY